MQRGSWRLRATSVSTSASSSAVVVCRVVILLKVDARKAEVHSASGEPAAVSGAVFDVKAERCKRCGDVMSRGKRARGRILENFAG